MAEVIENQLQQERFALETVALLASIEQRCRKYAAGLPQKEKLQRRWEGVMFYVGNERLVCPLSDVIEILNFPAAVTKVPGTKPWMLGISNNRGSLIPIIDLQLFLIGRRTERSRRNRVLVFNLWTGATGVLVGEMVGMRHFSKDKSTGKDSLSVRFDRYVQYGFDQDGETWPVFNLSVLAEDPAFQIAAV